MAAKKEKRQSIKTEVVPIPTSVEEAVNFLGKMGKLQREIGKVNTNLNNRVEKLKEQAMEKTVPKEKDLDQLFEGLFIYAQSHREELTEGDKKKTVAWPTGKILWKWSKPAVELLVDEDIIIKRLKDYELERLIHTKETVDKNAVLKEPEAIENIKGIEITQKENFTAKPDELKIEISRTIMTPKKEIPDK